MVKKVFKVLVEVMKLAHGYSIVVTEYAVLTAQRHLRFSFGFKVDFGFNVD